MPNGKTVTIPYTPRPKQGLFHASGADECFFGGAKSPGKSLALVMEALAYALEHPGSDPHLFRESYEALEGNLIKEWKDRVPKDIYDFQETKHQAKLCNGSVVKFRFLENKGQTQDRYQGRSIPWIGIDELTKHDNETVQILLSCLRSSRKEWPARFRATGNPGGKGHKWVRERYIRATDYGKKKYVDPVTGSVIEFIPSTVYDGVMPETDPTYVRRLENLPEKEKQAYLYGNWDIFEGQFFEEFGIHLRVAPRPLDEYCMLYGSLDHGEAAPTSFGLWWIDGNGKPHRIMTYYYPYDKPKNPGQPTRSTQEHAYAIARKIRSFPYSHGRPPRYVWCDPSMWKRTRLEDNLQPSFIEYYEKAFKEVFADAGFKEYKTAFVKADNDRVNGCIEMRNRYMTIDGVPNSFYWDKYNEPYEKLIPEQQHDDKDPEVYDTKLEDHLADDSRYLFMGIRGIKVQSVSRNPEEEENKQKIINPYKEMYSKILRPTCMT